jgi:2'-hydroxyisoflavone reductase
MVGGTRFVGRALVEAALGRGHEVTLLHRGRTGADLFPTAEHRTGDRDADLSALAVGEWDATVDTCAYFPRQVRGLAQALGGRGGRHLLVSSVSAYADGVRPGYREDAPLLSPAGDDVTEVTVETYGPLKVACERAAVQAHGADTLLVRPTYVIGPHDPTGRFPWWVRRLARGGEVLAPGPAEAPIQYVDARDLGAWMVGLLEQGESGALHPAAPRPPYGWGELLEAVAAAVAPAGARLRWVDAGRLLGEGVDGRALPLWSEGAADVDALAGDPSAAEATGLAPRPLADSARDTLAWLLGPDAVPMPPRVGLDPGREAELLQRLG